MIKKKRPVLVVTIVALAILIGLFFVFRTTRVHLQSPVVLLPDPQRVSGGMRIQTVHQNNAVFESSQAYSNKIMQFDKNCVASPVTISAKTGDSIMFDNQSNYQRSITVGNQDYTIAPFGHIVLSFGTIDTYQVSCDSFQKVGLIGIQ